ncbi:hypothetical protein B5F18_02515 [Lachnoclostridium sp. An181]|nr:hypothetical protein B5F18_02515 [Lachnoclostridium sp. An181]
MKSIFNLMYDYAVLANLVQYNPAKQFTLKGIQGRLRKIEKIKTQFCPSMNKYYGMIWTTDIRK